MMIMADNLLSEGMAKEVEQLNEKLFLEVYSTLQKTKPKKEINKNKIKRPLDYLKIVSQIICSLSYQNHPERS